MDEIKPLCTNIIDFISNGLYFHGTRNNVQIFDANGPEIYILTRLRLTRLRLNKIKVNKIKVNEIKVINILPCPSISKNKFSVLTPFLFG